MCDKDGELAVAITQELRGGGWWGSFRLPLPKCGSSVCSACVLTADRWQAIRDLSG